ncbi:hypothetical protein RU85_GL000997 [Lactococcus garvieae]|nr:hypothetical protein RU85_GL000997 [Lactococcus garvieae]
MEGKLTDFANGHKYFGFQQEKEYWTFREWAPHAEKAFLVGDFNDWTDKHELKAA